MHWSSSLSKTPEMAHSSQGVGGQQSGLKTYSNPFFLISNEEIVNNSDRINALVDQFASDLAETLHSCPDAAIAAAEMDYLTVDWDFKSRPGQIDLDFKNFPDRDKVKYRVKITVEKVDPQ